VDELKLASSLGWPASDVVCYVGEENAAERYVNLYRQCGRYFGNRIHGAVMARAAGAATWCVGYDSRLGMVERVGGKVSRPSEYGSRDLTHWTQQQKPGAPFDLAGEFDKYANMLRGFAAAGGAL